MRVWDPLNSNMYTLKVELVGEGKTVDVYEQPFDVRTVEVKDDKFLINNNPFLLQRF
ncbi:hypothetical protein [Bacillus solitudinis]|uniref:hypothetical protein n=1 Tax=Bacillus solitudinis TaxID=2014074 RepID=UPI0029DE7914|nr:hypothetical protein [Bacillus solitudinis]